MGAPKYLADRCKGECAFPLQDVPVPAWDMSRQLFCCEPVEPGEEYCPHHLGVVYPRRARK